MAFSNEWASTGSIGTADSVSDLYGRGNIQVCFFCDSSHGRRGRNKFRLGAMEFGTFKVILQWVLI